jgi:hypothetical protein
MTYVLISLIVLAVLLIRNYAKDKGAHNRAKVFHALALAFVILFGPASLGNVASHVQYFSSIKEHFYVPVGWVPAPVNLTSTLLAPVFHAILFLAAFAATQRSAVAIKIFRVVLLATIPFLVINVYVQTLESATVSVSLVIAAIIMVAIKLAFFFLYGSRMMKAFLGARAEVTWA